MSLKTQLNDLCLHPAVQTSIYPSVKKKHACDESSAVWASLLVLLVASGFILQQAVRLLDPYCIGLMCLLLYPSNVLHTLNIVD